MEFKREMTISTLAEMCELMCGSIEGDFEESENYDKDKNTTIYDTSREVSE